MRVIVTDAFWHDGRLVQESRYEDEMEVEAEKEEEEEDAPDWGGEEEEVRPRRGCWRSGWQRVVPGARARAGRACGNGTLLPTSRRAAS